MINEGAKDKFIEDKIYKKNNKTIGKTLYITQKSTSKNIKSYNNNINPPKEKKYLKKSINKKIIITNDNINNIISSINKSSIVDITKKQPNISLINNSLILNYMNKINNNFTLDKDIILVKTDNNKIRSSLSSNENGNENENKSQDNIQTPKYKKMKIIKDKTINKGIMTFNRLKTKKNNNIILNESKFNFKIKVNKNSNMKINNNINIEKLVNN